MRVLLLLVLVTTFVQAYSQKRGFKVQFAPDIILSGSVGEFNRYRHRIDTCIEAGQPYICRIDGKSFFGLDRGLDLPETELFHLTVQLKGKRISLDVSGMFNPTFDAGLRSGKFTLKKVGDLHFLQSHFSDGAGTYIAKWKIKKGKSERVLISNDEKDFGQ